MATKTASTRTASEPKAKAKPGFTVAIAELSAALGRVGLALAGPSTNIAALSQVKAHVTKTRMVLTASDLEHTISTTVPVTDGEPGDFMIPAKTVGNVIRTLGDGSVTCTSDGDQFTLDTGEYRATLHAADVDDFAVPAPVKGDSVTFDAIAFRAGVKRTAPVAMSVGDDKPVLTAVLLNQVGGKLEMASTDTYRLSVARTEIELPVSFDETLLVPGTALDKLNRLLTADDADVAVTVGTSAIEFKFGKTVLISRLIEGDFPTYQNLLPKSFHARATVPRPALVQATKRAFAVNDDDTCPVRLQLTPVGVRPSTVGAVGEGAEVIDGQCVWASGEAEGNEFGTKDRFEVAFNPRYLIPGLEMFEAGEVTIHFGSERKPALITAENTESVYLIMPVKIPEAQTEPPKS